MKKNSQNKYRSPQRSVVILLLLSFFLSTQVYAFAEPKVSFGFRNASFGEVIKKVEKVFNIQFTYDPVIIGTNTRIDLPKKERTLDETLRHLSELTGLRFMQSGKLVGIQRPEKSISSNKVNEKPKFEKVTIKGKVTDNNNQPVAGATVAVKGTTKGVTTDAGGNFSIEVETGDVLEISFVDFATQQIVAEKSTTLNIVLSPTGRALEEVVVTALGVRKEKAKVAYAMQEIKGDALQKAPETNVANNLVGKDVRPECLYQINFV